MRPGRSCAGHSPSRRARQAPTTSTAAARPTTRRARALIGELVAELLDPGVQAIGGPATAANPIITATQIASTRAGRPIDAFYVRSQTKDHGTRRLVEGNLPGPGAEVVIVDDTMTTGGSLRHAIEAVEAEGCKVARVIVVVDRGEGGADALRARGYQVSALFHADANGNLS